MNHRKTLKAMGITVSVSPENSEITINTPQGIDLGDIEVHVTQEDIDSAATGNDMIRRGVERALVRALVN